MSAKTGLEPQRPRQPLCQRPRPIGGCQSQRLKQHWQAIALGWLGLSLYLLALVQQRVQAAQAGSDTRPEHLYQRASARQRLCQASGWSVWILKVTRHDLLNRLVARAAMEESNSSPGRRVKTRQKSQLEPSADGAQAPGAGHGATTRLLRHLLPMMKTPAVKLYLLWF